jgi:hypothetical protein
VDTQYLAWERKHRAHERHVAALLVALLLLVGVLAVPIVNTVATARAVDVVPATIQVALPVR